MAEWLSWQSGLPDKGGAKSWQISRLKSVIKGTVKTLDRSSIAAERARSAFIRTKESAASSVSPAESSVEEYGADLLQNTAQRIAEETVYQFKKKGQNGFRDVKKNTDKVKENIRKIKELGKDQPKKQPKNRRANRRHCRRWVDCRCGDYRRVPNWLACRLRVRHFLFQ